MCNNLESSKLRALSSSNTNCRHLFGHILQVSKDAYLQKRKVIMSIVDNTHFWCLVVFNAHSCRFSEQQVCAEVSRMFVLFTLLTRNFPAGVQLLSDMYYNSSWCAIRFAFLLSLSSINRTPLFYFPPPDSLNASPICNLYCVVIAIFCGLKCCFFLWF